MLGRKILIGSLQIAGGQGTVQALSFARNLLIARIVGPEQFGLALTLVLVISLIEMTAETSADKFIVQDREGNDRRVQSTLHLFMVLRGIVFAVLLLLGAEIIVAVLGVPEDVAWSYRALGLATLCNGLIHLDIKRFHREMRYQADMAAEVAGNAAAFIVGVALAWTLGDYRAMLYALLARYATTAAISHVFADRPYRIWFSTDVGGRVWRFAWPLMINGLVLFVANQGDRALIGRFFGMEALGIFGAAVLVIHALGMILVKVISTIGLPILASKQLVRSDYDVAYYRVGSVVTLLAIACVAPLIAVLPPLIPMVFGKGYDIPPMLVSLLVVALGIKIFRSWGNVAALAFGGSHLVMISNIVRTAGFGIAFLIIVLGGNLVHVAGSQVIAEIIAAMTIFPLLRRRYGLRLGRAGAFFGIVIGASAACLYFEWMAANVGLALALPVHAAILVVGVAALYLASPEIRGWTKEIGGALWRPAAKV